MDRPGFARVAAVLFALCVQGTRFLAVAAESGTSPADWQADLARAADISRQREVLSDRYWRKKDLNGRDYAIADRALASERAQLRTKWEKAGRGPAFEAGSRDLASRAAASAPGQSASRPASPLSARSAPDFGDRYPVIATILGMLAMGSIFLGLPAFGLWILYLLFHRPPQKTPVSTTFGSAHYAPLEVDITDPTCLARGLFLGKSSGPQLPRGLFSLPGAPICSTPEHHTLIVARTRTGKGTRVIVPTLLRYGGSALVIDPKGENAAITGRARREQLRQAIQVLNPWNELSGVYRNLGFAAATYNPLDILDRDDPNAVAIAQTLAGAICPAPSNAKDKFWQGSAANILAAVFLYLADEPGEKKTLARAREIVSLTRKQFTSDFLIPMAAKVEAFGGAIREMATPFIDLAQETYSGVMSNLSENTKFLSDPRIKAATAQSSFSMEDLARTKTTVYVVIPPERMDTQRTWLRLIIAAAMHVFKNPQARIDPLHRCLFLIDEFASLGRLDDLPRDIAMMSGFGVDFALVVQGLDQLKDHYGEARSTILSNCAYKWFCNVNDLESAKYLSETLGRSTVKTLTTSQSVSGGGHGQRGSESVSQGETGRPLLTPDEVLNLGRDVAIAIQPKGHPHYLKPIDYWNLMEAFAPFHQPRPWLYVDPPLAYDGNLFSAGNGAAEANGMSLERARQILRVPPGADGKDIRAACEAFLRSVPPDLSRSALFKQEVEAAKSVLLAH